MDPYAQAGMIFTQAARLDQDDRSQLGAQIAELHGTMQQLEGHVSLMSERQDFVENLLSHREPGKLPEGEDWRRS